MADLTQLTDNLWTGGAITNAADVDQLVTDGITADLDLREEDDRSISDVFSSLPNASDLIDGHPRIAYLYNGTPDDGQPKPISWFQASWEFAKPILDDGGILLAHCAAGVNRGPSTAYFILRAYDKMSGDAAYQLITEKRPVAEVRYRPDADEALVALDLA